MSIYDRVKKLDFLKVVTVALFSIMTISTFCQVVFRYVFNSSLTWSEELVAYTFIWITLLGVALVTRSNSHISVDTIEKLLPKKIRLGLDSIFYILEMLFFASLVYFGIDLTKANIMQSASSIPISVAWSYAAVPVGAIFVMYFLTKNQYNKTGSLKLLSAMLLAVLILSWLIFSGHVMDLNANQLASFLTANRLAILLITLFGFLLLGMPIGFSIGIAAFLYVLIRGNVPLTVIPQFIIFGINKFSLIAVPFFILAGALMNYGGITKKLVDFCNSFVGHITGGLSQVVVLSNMIMAGISGTAVSDAAATGAILIPSMVEKGYSKKFAAAITASAAIAGPIIPPSVPMVILGVSTGVSIGRLFMGGAVPGLMMCGGLMIACYIIAKKRNYLREKKATWEERWIYTKKAIYALFMPLIILGGILSGIFTPTEAGVIATVYALIGGIFVYKKIGLIDLPRIFKEAAEDTARVMLIIGVAAFLGWVLAEEQVPDLLVKFMYSLTNSHMVMLLILNITLLIIGCFFESTASIILLAPLLMPLITSMGVDPIHFGVVMILNLMIGLLTPPVGVCLFVSGSIAKVSVSEVCKEVWPFLIILIVVLLLITYIPQLVLFLPNLLMN
jgi:C4-dicarboxylate transporter DctM subunit